MKEGAPLTRFKQGVFRDFQRGAYKLGLTGLRVLQRPEKLTSNTRKTRQMWVEEIIRPRTMPWQTRVRRYQPLLVGLGVLIFLAGVILVIWKIPQQQVAPWRAKLEQQKNTPYLSPGDYLRLQSDARKLENDARIAVIQALGGAALIIALYFTAKTLRTTQEGQITDRFTKAINQLGETDQKSWQSA